MEALRHLDGVQPIMHVLLEYVHENLVTARVSAGYNEMAETSSRHHKKMPLPFVPTGSDLSATHGTAAFFELVGKLQLLELAQPEATRPNNVSLSADQETQTQTLTVSLPIVTTVNAAGRPEDAASPYMIAPFVPGTGTLKSDTYPEAILELATIIEAYELSLPEATRPDRIQISKSGGIATISCSAPIVVSFGVGGNTVLAPADYA
jgi:hypothetical protein